MKIRDILQPKEQLDEISLKQAIAAGLIGTAALAPHTNTRAEVPQTMATQVASLPRLGDPIQPKYPQEGEWQQQALSQSIAQRYHIAPTLAAKIVTSAYEHAYQDFPTPKDILAIVGIESGFNPHAVGTFKSDPELGLMQIRPKLWNVKAKDLRTVDANIRHGAEILRHYYTKLGSKLHAIQAYNAGPTKAKRGLAGPEYLNKYQREYRRHMLAMKNP